MVLFCLMVPSFLGLKLADALLRNTGIKDAFINYGVINLLTNLISIGVSMVTLKFFVNLHTFTYNIENFDKVAYVYLILATMVSLVVGFVYSFILKSISISLEKNDKKRKKN